MELTETSSNKSILVSIKEIGYGSFSHESIVLFLVDLDPNKKNM